MSGEGPWGIVVTRTLHLTEVGTRRPACGDERVRSAMDARRALYRQSGGYLNAPPIFDLADGRPVCRRCVRATERRIDFLREQLAEVAEYQRGLP